MNLRPTAALLHGMSVASVTPRSLGVGLPRVVAFPLLLFGCSDSNGEATLCFFRTAEAPLVWESLTGFYPSSPPQIHLFPGSGLEERA